MVPWWRFCCHFQRWIEEEINTTFFPLISVITLTFSLLELEVEVVPVFEKAKGNTFWLATWYTIIVLGNWKNNKIARAWTDIHGECSCIVMKLCCINREISPQIIVVEGGSYTRTTDAKGNWNRLIFSELYTCMFLLDGWQEELWIYSIAKLGQSLAGLG